MRRRDFLIAGAAGLAAVRAGSGARAAEAPLRTYGLSLLGPPKLPADFAHFPYANPDAPAGGDVALADLGSFDSYNPFIVRGTAPAAIGRVWDTLTRSSADEPSAGSLGGPSSDRP